MQKSAKQTALSVKNYNRQIKLLRMLLYISISVVIIFLSYLVINPNKLDADKRNATRTLDIANMMSEITRYKESFGSIPDIIPLSKECGGVEDEICKSGQEDCKYKVDMSFLLESEKRGLSSMPEDPLSKSTTGTGYYISHDGEGNIVICAPLAERNVKISVEKFIY